MKPEDIEKIIAEDFLWLTPNEKEKLEIIIKNVWNDAIQYSIERLDHDHGGHNKEALTKFKL